MVSRRQVAYPFFRVVQIRTALVVSPELTGPGSAVRRGSLAPVAKRGTAAQTRRGRLDQTRGVELARAALAALDLDQDLARRAARLTDVAAKLRAKGKTGAIEADVPPEQLLNIVARH
jgi:hypothetical protein